MLLAALGRPVTLRRDRPHLALALCRAAVAGHGGARENRAIDFDALVDFSRDAVAATKGTLLIEGIGGIMVPLDDKHTVLDWMTALHIPLVLVTGSYLGTLSHTLTASTCWPAAASSSNPSSSTIRRAQQSPMQNASDTLANFARPIPIVGAAAASSGPHWRRGFREYREAAGELARLEISR